MIEPSQPVGLCSNAALQKLCRAIEDELQTQDAQWRRQQTLLSTISQAPGFSLRTDNAFHWTSAIWVLLAAMSLLVAAGASGEIGLVVDGAVLLCVLVINLYVTGWDSRMRHREVIMHAHALLKKLQELTDSGKKWEPTDYLNLYSPPSGGISVIWTYRDNTLVNLPCCLLVKDDVIVLRPGQAAPTKVSSYESFFEHTPRGSEERQELFLGETYKPSVPESCTEPTARKPLKPAKFLVKEIPYIPLLRSCLEEAVKKPGTSMENKRIMGVRIIEHYTMPLVLFVSVVINVIRLAVLGGDHGHWADMLIAIQISSILPLLSLALPIMWIVLNTYGIACIVTLFHKLKHFEEDLATDYSEDTEANYRKFMKDKWSWREVWHHFLQAFIGQSQHLPRTSNLLHCLGNVTSLCCVDKRGILSYPDPTVEKVFFMSGMQDDQQSDSDSVFTTEGDIDLEESQRKAVTIDNLKEKVMTREDHFPEIHSEVLTLSVDSNVFPPGVQFDDKHWERHISSLKPMGLNILLNNCHQDTVDRYSHFLDHVYSSVNHEEIRQALRYSRKSENPGPEDNRRTVHVPPRRCMCQLAHLIGFTEQATQGYDLKHQLAMYRLVHGHDSEDHHHVPKARSFIKRKIPAPHLLSVSVHDSRSGHNQLLTQGTADLVLSLSTDFWDGSDLCHLTDNERKKIMDFYQRATLSSYCSAFSYQPMVESMANYFDDLYLELPNHSKDTLTSEPVSPGVARSSWDVGMTPNSVSTPKPPSKGRKYHSLESAMDNLGDIRDSESCYRAQCGQIFIGMVASNYLPRPGVVALIENLDDSCIRFVHFSRDQELRSRVFTEKMGLEAGWNCHISLLSEEENTSSSNSPPNTHQQTSRQHSDASAKSSHSNTCQVPTTSADVCNVRVSWQDMAAQDRKAAEAMAAASPSDAGKISEVSIEMENIPASSPSPIAKDKTESTTKDLRVEFRNTEGTDTMVSIETNGKDVEFIDENGGGNNASTGDNKPAATSSDSAVGRTGSGTINVKNLTLDVSKSSEEAESLLRADGRRKSSSGSEELRASLRNRHVSETQGFSDGNDTDTLSHYTESDTTGGFDISNRAKLPRGIENIRPHLDKVDNVPLLVPLFTDVTHETTREMIKIMQENGEVVCCMGCSVGIKNMPLFTQADISIGIEPLYPHTCLNKDQTGVELLESNNGNHEDSPMGLAGLLTCLPTSLWFHSSTHISIIELIKEARGLCMGITNCFSFMMYGLFSICAIQLVASLLFLPPPLSSRHVLWLVLVVMPTLSISLVGSPFQSQLMTYATGKNLKQIDKEVTVQYGFYFVSKFLSSVLVSLLCFALILRNFCQRVAEDKQSCHMLLGYRNSSDHWNGLKGEHYSFLVFAQNAQTFLLTFYLIVTSASFVHRLKSMWRRPPFTNHLWCAVVILLLLFEIIYFVLDVRIWNSMPEGYPLVGLRDVPLEVWIIAFVWPLVCLAVCEIIKIFEIRVFVRWQKRTKLQFGTKLGMNSPF